MQHTKRALSGSLPDLYFSRNDGPPQAFRSVTHAYRRKTRLVPFFLSETNQGLLTAGNQTSTPLAQDAL